MKISNKLEMLRKAMQSAGVQACIVPTTDPHISEYTPARWETRQWITGFTGSAGTAVITLDKAGLWTDSRYFLQAAQQLEGTGIQLFKAGLPDTPTYMQWLESELPADSVIGIEGDVFAANEVLAMQQQFSSNQLKLNTDFAPWDELWSDRPTIPSDKIFTLPIELTGLTVIEKIKTVTDEIVQAGASGTVLASLDTIAWMFNLRGTDIPYNPVAVSYAYISSAETVLFINPEKVTEESLGFLSSQGVTLADYNKIYSYIDRLPKQTKLLVAPSKINFKLYKAIEEHCTLVTTDIHPVDRLKSVKNPIEIAGMRNAMEKDGVALVRFLMWLEKAMDNRETVTELDIARKLVEYRSEQPLYFSESFGTIAGYNDHGAIVHYSANEESNAVIKPGGLLLVDSGAQYFDGTTDITRTIAVGPVSPEMKHDFTQVLKGNIALSSARFPQGTVGMQLDILARQFLWKSGENYLHGTGHGIGCFLNVHEGPQSIRMNYNPEPIRPGMITSNEPGLYRAGQYGIRIENLLLTIEDGATDFGQFNAFETLTLCPIDTNLIDDSLMSPEEITWLNNYHNMVHDLLSPMLNEEEREWLRKKCAYILEF